MAVEIACVPGAIPADQRERWIRIGRAVYAAAQEVRELPDGWALRLPSDRETLRRVVNYVSLDRLCCPFVSWAIIVEPDGGPAWLHMSGPEGTKALTRASLETTDLLRESVAAAAGFSLELRRPVQVEQVDALVTDLNRRACC